MNFNFPWCLKDNRYAYESAYLGHVVDVKVVYPVSDEVKAIY